MCQVTNMIKYERVIDFKSDDVKSIRKDLYSAETLKLLFEDI